MSNTKPSVVRGPWLDFRRGNETCKLQLRLPLINLCTVLFGSRPCLMLSEVVLGSEQVVLLQETSFCFQTTAEQLLECMLSK